MGLLSDAQFRITAFERNTTFGRADKTCDQAQQGAFAGSVRTGQDRRFTGRD